jgi:hypothetical protein
MTKNFAANMKIGAMMGSSVGRVFGGVNKKIKEQEATLKGLRAAYKDAAKGTGEFAGNLAKLEREITSAESKLKRLRDAAKIDLGASLRGVGSKFGGDMKRLGVVGGVMGAAGIGIAKNMLDVTAAFEKSLTILKTVEGSAEKAGQSFAWIQDFAQKTPFELQQVTDAFVRLRAYGIDPIRGDSLRILGDTASAMGKDVMDAVEAIADAVTGENERLKEFGIKASKEGAKTTYTWTDRAGKQMKKTIDGNNRALIQSTLLAIWNSKYKGAMDEQSRTWNGMVSNLKDTWARFAFDVMQSGPFEELKNQLQSFLDKVAVWAKDGTMKRWAERTGKFMIDAGKKIGEVVGGIFKALDATQQFLGGWDKLAYALIALNFAPTISAIGKLTASLWTLSGATWASVGPWAALAAALGGVFWVLQDLGDGDWQKGLSFAFMAIGKDIAYLGELIKKWWGDITNTFGRNIEALAGMMGEMKNWLGRNFEALIQMLLEISAKIVQIFVDMGQAIKLAFENALTFVSSKIDALLQKARSLGDSIKGFFGFGVGGAKTSSTTVTTPQDLPAAKRELSQNNNFNINVNAPGADGRRIADQLRNEFNRKPLFDMDGALAPG